jgi:hypothetical protein
MTPLEAVRTVMHLAIRNTVGCDAGWANSMQHRELSMADSPTPEKGLATVTVKCGGLLLGPVVPAT